MENRKPNRLPALALPTAQRPSLVLRHPYSGSEAVPVRNLGKEGLLVRRPDPPFLDLVVGERLRAELRLGGNGYLIEAEIIHFSQREIGLKYVNAPEDLIVDLDGLLSSSVVASQMSEHSKSGEIDEQWGYPCLRWEKCAQGDDKTQYELLVWYSKLQRMIVAVQLIHGDAWFFRRQGQPMALGTDPKLVPSGQSLVDLEQSRLPMKIEPEQRHLVSQFLAAVPHPLPGTRLWQFMETGESVFLPEDDLK